MTGRERREVKERTKRFWALGAEISGKVLDLYPYEVARYAQRKTLDGYRVLGRFDTRGAAEARVLEHVQKACDRRNRAGRKARQEKR